MHAEGVREVLNPTTNIFHRMQRRIFSKTQVIHLENCDFYDVPAGVRYIQLRHLFPEDSPKKLHTRAASKNRIPRETLL